MATLAEFYGWKPLKTEAIEVKSKYGITSDFHLDRKGYFQIFNSTFFCIYISFAKKSALIQWRGKEWKRQREENFIRLHGMTSEEAQKPENQHLFVANTCIINKELQEAGLLE